MWGTPCNFPSCKTIKWTKTIHFFFFPGAMMTDLHCKPQLEPLGDTQQGGCFQRHLTSQERELLVVGGTIPWAGGLEWTREKQGTTSWLVFISVQPDSSDNVLSGCLVCESFRGAEPHLIPALISRALPMVTRIYAVTRHNPPEDPRRRDWPLLFSNAVVRSICEPSG